MSDRQPPPLLIEGHNLSKIFRDFWRRDRVTAVTGVDIEVPRGSVFGLLGPNGAGKSTLMKMILGHLYPTSGTLQVFGKPPTNVEIKQRLGYLPERAYLYKTLTPEEVLRFFGQILELSAGEIATRSDQLLSMVGLDHARKRLVGEFSHGMMRRMGLAQALLNDPDLLLLDEPTAGLDPIGCREVKNLLLTLARRGKTILLTSHLLADVEDVCSEILIMYGGRGLANGPVDELLAHKDQLQVRMPAPDAQGLDALRRVLATHAPAEANIEFSNPTRSLETYFLDVIRQASERHETQGAHIGKGVASYLRQGVEVPEEMLEALTHAKRQSETSAPPSEPEPAVDEEALEELRGEDAPPPPETPQADIDQQTLDELTRKKKP